MRKIKYSKSLIKTLRESPANCDSISQSLMYRTGMVKQESAGLYTYLPCFNMVLQKVATIIREELNKVDAYECKFPILVSKELLENSGRWDTFGDEMFKLQDRHKVEYALSPTNEEAATILAKHIVKSFKDLPIIVYQINTKHRDEIRPRGIGRTRAFTMKDAYSFHATEESLDETYKKIIETYIKIFSRMGLEAFPVDADNGTMGGSGSQEIMTISKEGEAFVAKCSKCGYAANLEVVKCIDKYDFANDKRGEYKKIYTPDCKSINDLVSLLKIDIKKFAKSMVYVADGKKVVVVVRGDREVNEIKLRNYFNAKNVELCEPEQINEINSIVGFVGPVKLKPDTTILVDYEVKEMTDFVIGANEKDYHFKDVNCKDFDKCEYTDLRFAEDGDIHECGGILKTYYATELGHCFKLGKRYTEKLGATFVNDNNKEEVMTMGCYGIGLERTVFSIIEQYHDEKGINWPINMAPIKIEIIPANKSYNNVAEKIYNKVLEYDANTLFDDRNVSFGIKLNDSELLGIPVRVIIGKNYENDGKFEISTRGGEKILSDEDDIIKNVTNIINNGGRTK